MTIHEHLKKIGACSEARFWASKFSSGDEVWQACVKPGWLLWWIGHNPIPSNIALLPVAARKWTSEYVARNVPSFEDQYIVADTANYAKLADEYAELARKWASECGYDDDAVKLTTEYTTKYMKYAEWAAYTASMSYTCNFADGEKESDYSQTKCNYIRELFMIPFNEI